MNPNWRSSNEDTTPTGELDAAHSGVYISDILRKMKSDGFNVTEESYAEVRDLLAEQYKKDVEKQKKMAGEAAKFGIASGALAQVGVPGFGSHGAAAAKSVEMGRVPELLDDIAIGETGDRARRLRAIRDEQIRVNESSLGMRALDAGAQQLTQVPFPLNLIPGVGGRVSLGTETDPTKDHGFVDDTLVQAAGMAGMMGNVALTSLAVPGAGSANAGMQLARSGIAFGSNVAGQPGRGSLAGKLAGFGEGFAMGVALPGVGAARSGLLRKVAGETGSARMAVDKFLRTGLSETMASGEMGAGFAVMEDLEKGKLPDPEKMLSAYLGFAVAHGFHTGMKFGSTGERVSRAAALKMRDFIRSEDGKYLRDLYEAGDPAPYFAAWDKKLAEFKAEVTPQRTKDKAARKEERASRGAWEPGKYEIPTAEQEFMSAVEGVVSESPAFAEQMRAQREKLKEQMAADQAAEADRLLGMRDQFNEPVSVRPPTERPIEPQDAPVFLDTPVAQPPKTTAQVIADLIPGSDASLQREQAGQAKQETAAQASRRVKMEESRIERERVQEARRIADEAEKARLEQSGGPMTAQRIVDISKEPDGMAQLKALGYEQVDVLRAVGKIKQQSRDLDNDVTLGFGLGGGQEQIKDALGLTARGVLRGTGAVVGKGIDAVNLAMRPYDRVVDRVNEIAYERHGKSLDEWVARKGDYLRETVFPKSPFYARSAAWAQEIAPLWTGTLSKSRIIKKEFRDLTDGSNAIVHAGYQKQDALQALLTPAVKAMKDVPEFKGMSEAQLYAIVNKMGEYAGSPETIEQTLADGLASPVRQVRARAERWKPIYERAVWAIRNPGSVPIEVKYATEQANEFYKSTDKHQHDTGMLHETFVAETFSTPEAAQKGLAKEISIRPEFNWRIEGKGTGKFYLIGDTGARKPGINYRPGARTVEIGEDGKPVKRKRTPFKRGAGTEASTTHARTIRDGSVYREIFLGEAQQSYNDAELYFAHHVDVYKAHEARLFVQKMAGYELQDGMPAAITESNMARAAARGGEQMTSDFGEYVEIPGFKFHDASGGTDKMLFHPDIARAVGNLYETPYHNWAIRLNSAMKIAVLTMSPFHYWALAMNTMAYGENPITAWKKHKENVFSPDAMRLVRAGLDINSSDMKMGESGFDKVWEEPLSSGGNVAKRAARGVARKVARSEKFFQTKLWDEFFRSTKIVSALAAERAYLAMGLPPEQALENAVIMINANHGGMNYKRLGMSIRARQVASMIMLAPDWTISNMVFTQNALVGTNSKAPVTRKALARFAVSTYVMSNAMNILTSGHPMWENDEGKKHLIEFRMGEQKLWADPWGHYGELIPVLIGTVNGLPGIDLSYGRNPAAWAFGKVSPVLSNVTQIVSGQTRWPPGHALPTLKDYVEGRSFGQWGRKPETVDAYALAVLGMYTPIMVKGTTDSVIDRGEDFWQDPRFLSGLFGRRVYGKTTKSTRPSKPQRPRR